jgi:hypothetical protein
LLPHLQQGQERERHRLVVDVVCGGVRAHFDARRMVVVMPDGRSISPIGQLPGLPALPACLTWRWMALMMRCRACMEIPAGALPASSSAPLLPRPS